MNKAQLAELVTLVEAHVALGDRHIARQKEIIADLDRRGHDTALARALLVQFEQSQVQHVSHRDQLLRQLAESSN